MALNEPIFERNFHPFKTLYIRRNLFMSDLFFLLRLQKLCFDKISSFIYLDIFSVNSVNELFNNLLGCSWQRTLDSNFISSYMLNFYRTQFVFTLQFVNALRVLLAENNKQKILLCRHSNFCR